MRVQALSSNARAARGVASLLQIYDELAHMQVGTPGPQTAEELYRALVPSLDQFHKDGFIYVPTSPYAKQGPAYETYQDGLATDLVTGVASHPEILVIQLPSWGPYEDFDDSAATEGRVFASAPQIDNDILAAQEARDPYSFRVERRAQWAEVVHGYLTPDVVDKMYAPFC